MRERLRRKASRELWKFTHAWKEHQFSGEGTTDRDRSALYGDAKVTIGRHSYTNGLRVYGWHGEQLTIGKFCSIAEGTAIILGDSHRRDHVTTSPMVRRLAGLAEGTEQPRDIVIGNDVWIGHHATILGCGIGDGAVIAAGSVVTKPVEPYAFVAGVPARVIEYRFEQPLRDQILALAWWDWPDDVITERASEFTDPAALVNRYS